MVLNEILYGESFASRLLKVPVPVKPKLDRTGERVYNAIVVYQYKYDYVDSFDTIDDAIAVTRSIIHFLLQSNFVIRGFCI